MELIHGFSSKLFYVESGTVLPILDLILLKSLQYNTILITSFIFKVKIKINVQIMRDKCQKQFLEPFHERDIFNCKNYKCQWRKVKSNL